MRWLHSIALNYALLFLVLIGAACSPNGTGFVEAQFEPAECPPGTRLEKLGNYGWDAGYFATERFFEVLIINVQEFNVDIFETDSVGIRLDLEGLEQAGRIVRDGRFFAPAQTPMIISVGDSRADAQVLLSLFQTCERLPGFSAVAGEVHFDEFRIRVDGSDSGKDERLIGRILDTQLSYPQAPEPIAQLEAAFDFRPPRRPLREFE